MRFEIQTFDEKGNLPFTSKHREAKLQEGRIIKGWGLNPLN